MTAHSNESRLTAQTAEFHEAISSGNFQSIKLLLASDRTLVNCPNEQGLLPLHQASFRGHTEVVDYLLKNGADVNVQDAQHGYTALMFAAITGNFKMARTLLQYGARSNYVNKVGRTASQMASFVSNHRVSALINNFFEKEELDYYLQPHINPKLQLLPNSASLLYELIIETNCSPIRVFLALHSEAIAEKVDDDPRSLSNDSLLSRWSQAVNVLEELLGKYFTPDQTHEALALKFHILACCLRKAGECVQSGAGDSPHVTSTEKCDEKCPPSPMTRSIKIFLRGGDPHGLPLGQEKFLRQSLVSFPRHESTLWRHIVNQISRTEPGSSPTALYTLESAINGRSMAMFNMDGEGQHSCATCGEPKEKDLEIKLCHNCKEVGYCSVACQRLHWFTHKKYCPVLKKHHGACERSRKEAETNAQQ